MMRKITNLVKEGNQFRFYEVGISSNDDIIVKEYITGSDGKGLYMINIYGNTQVKSKNDFDCSGKSKGAARKYINRKFGIINWNGKRK